MKKLSQAIALAGVMTAAAVPAVQAEVEVSASAAIANMYLWRGQDLTGASGAPAFSGDLSVSSNGAYAGVWASSGDSTGGNEYDLYLGYGGEAGDFSYAISAWTYIYPSASEDYISGNGSNADARSTIFDLADVIVSVGYAGASFSYYVPVGAESNDDYSYFTLGYGMGDYSATLGKADDGDEDYTHLDVSYAANDNLSFTLSKVVAQSADLDKGEAGQDEDLKVVVSYSLPIEL